MLQGFPRHYWRAVERLKISDDQQSMVWAIIIGLVVGLVSFLFTRLISGMGNLLFVMLPHWFGFEQPTDFGWQCIQPWIPALGGLIAGPIICKWAIEARGHGVPEVMLAMAREGGHIRPRVGAVKAGASALTISSGGSAGQEGPIVQIGAALGSVIGQFLHMPTRKIKTFVACGAAAGISAVFNTPIAGVFFAIEVLLGELRPRSFAFVVISSAAAWLTARTLMAEETLFEVRPWEFQHSWEFFLWVILGTIAAALGRLFVVVLYRTENFFDRLRLSPMLRPALGGLAVGIVGIAFPHVFGSGYKPMSAALNGTVFTRLGILHPGPLEENLDEILVPVLSPDGLGARLIDQLGAVPILHAILLLGMLALAKMLATSLTLGSGGSGGVFAPSLFIGGLFGAAFGLLLQIILPGQTGPPGAYALLGMAATFSAAAHAPVTAILITFEITNYNEAMVPGLMVSSVVAILLAYRLAGDSIYTVKFKRLGLRIGDSQARDPMKQIQVRDAMATEFFTMPLTMTIREAQLYAETVGQRAYPVVGKSETDLAGLITVYDLNLAVAGNRPDDTPIRDIMDPSPPTSTPDEYLDRAFKILEESEAAMLPILATGQQRLIGILTHATMVRAYTEYQLNRE